MSNYNTLSDEQVATNAIIAQQNDAYRAQMGVGAMWNDQPIDGQCLMTRGIQNLPMLTLVGIMQAVRSFREFTEENDPWGDHSFGVVEVNGVKAYWKIDLYDTKYSMGAAIPEAAHDPKQARRVLTVLLPSEY